MWIRKIKNWAKQFRNNLVVLHIAYMDPRTPWYAKFVIFITIAYALSPIDLIPDFIPVLGYLDDIIIVPFGFFLSIKLIPNSVIEDAKINSKNYQMKNKSSLIGLILIISIWVLVAIAVLHFFV